MTLLLNAGSCGCVVCGVWCVVCGVNSPLLLFFIIQNFPS
jgi:hypothetical protein